MAKNQAHPGQLDLFLHSDATVFANEAVDALVQGDAARAAECLGRLEAEEPGYGGLDALHTLCRALRERPWPSSNPAGIAAAVRRLETEWQPAAVRVLGNQAQNFLRSFWRGLAEAARSHPYDPDFPQAFRAGLCLRAGDARAAGEAAESVPGRDDNPDALYWLALARHGMGGLEACRPVLLRLALLAPQRLSSAIIEIGDPALQRDWKAFRAGCSWLDPNDATAAAWFPAWYLLQHPGIRIAPDAPPLPSTPAAEAFATMARLNALENHGYSAELISTRSRLRELEPELFGLYMVRGKAGRP